MIKTYLIKSHGESLMLGLPYHLATLHILILIVTFSAPIFTNAILKNMIIMKIMKKISEDMKVYISGKIGEEVISEATRRKFAKAEAMLKGKGYEVENPCDGLWQQQLKNGYGRKVAGNWDYKPSFYSYVLLRDMGVLAACDAIYMLEDWDLSSGANVELAFARATGKKVLWQSPIDAQAFRDDNEKAEDVWLPIEGKEPEP